jgi:hypothetical protein
MVQADHSSRRDRVKCLARFAALDMVDATLLFEGEALPELIDILRPHIHVKRGRLSRETLTCCQCASRDWGTKHRCLTHKFRPPHEPDHRAHSFPGSEQRIAKIRRCFAPEWCRKVGQCWIIQNAGPAYYAVACSIYNHFRSLLMRSMTLLVLVLPASGRMTMCPPISSTTFASGKDSLV